MPSSSNQRHRKTGSGGPSNKGDRKYCSFDDILLDYEKFVYGERTGHQGDEADVAHQREVTGSSTSGRTEVRGDQRESAELSSLGDHDESEWVVPGVEAASGGGLETETGSSSFPSLVITMASLVKLVHTFYLPRRHKVLIPRVTNILTHHPQGYVAISSHHLSAELRFPFPRLLIRVLNLLELVPMQLTPNAYTQLLSFFLIFIRKRIGSSTDNIIRHCFQMKKCPKKSLGVVRPD
ncbi:hypothetical protein ACOSP7_016571 [Xanthoceras sorbifolium]